MSQTLWNLTCVFAKWYQTWNRCSVALFQCCFVMDGECYGEKVEKKRSVYSVFCHLIMCSDYSREVSTSQPPRERMCKNTKGLIVFLYLVAGPWQTPDSIWSLTKIKWWIRLYRMYTRCKPDPKSSHNSVHQSALTNHHVMYAGDMSSTGSAESVKAALIGS